MEAQVGVGRIGRGGRQVDRADHDLLGGAAHLVGPCGGGQLRVERMAGGVGGSLAELRRGVPCIEDGAVGPECRERDAPGGGDGRLGYRGCHGPSLRILTQLGSTRLSGRGEEHTAGHETPRTGGTAMSGGAVSG